MKNAHTEIQTMCITSNIRPLSCCAVVINSLNSFSVYQKLFTMQTFLSDFHSRMWKPVHATSIALEQSPCVVEIPIRAGLSRFSSIKFIEKIGWYSTSHEGDTRSKRIGTASLEGVDYLIGSLSLLPRFHIFNLGKLEFAARPSFLGPRSYSELCKLS